MLSRVVIFYLFILIIEERETKTTDWREKKRWLTLYISPFFSIWENFFAIHFEKEMNISPSDLSLSSFQFIFNFSVCFSQCMHNLSFILIFISISNISHTKNKEMSKVTERAFCFSLHMVGYFLSIKWKVKNKIRFSLPICHHHQSYLPHFCSHTHNFILLDYTHLRK